MRLKGRPIPANIILISLNNTTAYLFHSADYMELYRIVDYQESRTPVQQLTGLKNILLLSGDRTLPRLRMVGIRGSSRILDEIRIRVEYNKKRRGIYEITNRN